MHLHDLPCKDKEAIVVPLVQTKAINRVNNDSRRGLHAHKRLQNGPIRTHCCKKCSRFLTCYQAGVSRRLSLGFSPSLNIDGVATSEGVAAKDQPEHSQQLGHHKAKLLNPIAPDVRLKSWVKIWTNRPNRSNHDHSQLLSSQVTQSATVFHKL